MWPAIASLAFTLGAGTPAASAASCPRVIGGRTGHALTYDPTSRRVLLYGGVSDDSTDRLPRSLWAWDGRNWTCVDADGPPGRDSPELAFDVKRKRLVLFGGRTIQGGNQMRVLSDTWEWDGSRWTRADTVGPGEQRIHMGLAYDPSRQAVLLHGGLRAGPALGLLRDTWQWDGSRWRTTTISV